MREATKRLNEGGREEKREGGRGREGGKQGQCQNRVMVIILIG